MRALALSLAVAAAAGCTGGLFRSDAKPEQTYVLRAPSAVTAPADGAAGNDSAAATASAAAPPGAALASVPDGEPPVGGWAAPWLLASYLHVHLGAAPELAAAFVAAARAA